MKKLSKKEYFPIYFNRRYAKAKFKISESNLTSNDPWIEIGPTRNPKYRPLFRYYLKRCNIEILGPGICAINNALNAYCKKNSTYFELTWIQSYNVNLAKDFFRKKLGLCKKK